MMRSKSKIDGLFLDLADVCSQKKPSIDQPASKKLIHPSIPIPALTLNFQPTQKQKEVIPKQ